MTHKKLLETALVLLASSTLFSLEQKLILFPQGINRESLQLLNNWQSSSLQRCLSHRRNFLLPQKSMNSHQYQKGHRLAILHEMLQQIFNLFKANISLGGWEENHIETFLIRLHQQLEYLEALLGLEAEKKSGDLVSEHLRLQIKAYFQRIRSYLKSQGFSSCAQTIVQVEISRCLFFVFRLTGRLNKQERDP